MAVIVYPGMGVGKTFRPRIAWTIGFSPIGSALTPTQIVISQEELWSITGETIDVAYSTISPDVTRSDIPVGDVISEIEEFLTSQKPTETMSGDLPDGTVTSTLPPENVTSEEPDD